MGDYRGTFGAVSTNAQAPPDRQAVLADGTNALTLHGAGADVIFGSQTAARLQSWTIRKSAKGHWVLRATVVRADAFLCVQRGLLFTAPRDRHGNWAWGIERLAIEGHKLKAILGKPEQ